MGLNYVGVLLLCVSKTPLNPYITFLLMYSAFKQPVRPFTALLLKVPETNRLISAGF